MPVFDDDAYLHRRHNSWDLEHCEVPFQYLKLSMLWDTPPENALQGRVLSEHELRVQRSLQQLNVPDWYKNSVRPSEGFLLKRGSDAGAGVTASAGRRGAGGWPGLGVKTTSLSSLGTGSLRSPTTAVRLGSSPSPPPSSFTRWSSSRLHGAGCAGSAGATPSTSPSVTPSGSARSSFNHRQPYLGWRSQERLSGTPRTPAERLAQGLLEQREQQRLRSASARRQEPCQDSNQLQSSPNLSDVRSSIKEVTSAIVHYVSNANGPGSTSDVRLGAPAAASTPAGHPGARAAATSTSSHSAATPATPQAGHNGNSRVCWIESSFVGSRPLEPPQTPDESAVSPHQDLYLDLQKRAPCAAPAAHQSHGAAAAGASAAAAAAGAAAGDSPTSPTGNHGGALGAALALSRPSPTSTTMEDVLDSLLGLPPPSRSPSPGPAGSASAASSAPGSGSGPGSTHTSTQVPPPQLAQPPASAPAMSPQPAQPAPATLRSCADIRPDPAGSASGGSGPGPVDAAADWEGAELQDADEESEPAGWEASDLAGPTCAASGPASCWPPCPPPGPPPGPAPPGWQGTAVVGVLAEEGADGLAEAEFGAALLSLPLDPPTEARPEQNGDSEEEEDDEGVGGSKGRSRRRDGRPRRVSFDLGAGLVVVPDGETGEEAVTCRRHGCGRVAPESVARLRFKTCHNCTHAYCSRECRRDHWGSHKRACAVQRVSGLLRRVVASVRRDTAALSEVARRGYLAHGRGVVRVFLQSADVAEAYCAGSACVEHVYVRWADLPAGELGESLHEDITRLCNTYNPATRAVTLIVLEVLSEAPSDDGVVMWERQLVSRVFKVHLFEGEAVASAGAAAELGAKTLVLMCMRGAATTRAARHVVLKNIVSELRDRGVNLRAQYPDTYRHLKDYVDGSTDSFVPLTLCPQVNQDPLGSRIIVVLMPDADPARYHALATSEDAETVDVSKSLDGDDLPLNKGLD